ncbi:hypothetical protein LCGC14_2179290 [marine sediment metagenome]|uniref:S-adenosylmethionine decarboxylase proenzyme n=1 Tax=marine sediment metagenome TaxID=412755 RepID=A0A0F9DMS8_9ZZZZ
MVNDYGKELIMDLHNCNSTLFTRKNIRRYFKKVCNLINMERCKLCWWDDLYTPIEEKETEPHLVGTSAVQFIKTSNITIHTLEKLHRVYLNIFSCKDFDDKIVIRFSEKWFEGKIVNKQMIRRM